MHHNGNLISDTGKGMTAGYNHLNLPREVTLQSINGIDPGGIIQWVYDATGRKLKKVSPDGITLYHDGIEKAGGGTFVYHAEGRAAFYPGNPTATPPVEDRWDYEFAMRDHLGNTRITFADLNYDGYLQANPGDWIFNDPHGSPVGYTEVLQENHYYPFGMNMEGPWREPEVEGKVNRYQYNGKELNSDLGLGWNDYGARWYDAAIGRWNAVDPLAEEAPDWTPYRYAFNNPLIYIDPDGLFEDEAAAKKYAEEKNIKLRPEGFIGRLFTSRKRSEIVEQSDGTFAIENTFEKTSISDMAAYGFEDMGVRTTSLNKATDVMETRIGGGEEQSTLSRFLNGPDLRFVNTLRDGSEVDGGPAMMTGTAPSPGKILKGVDGKTISRVIKIVNGKKIRAVFKLEKVSKNATDFSKTSATRGMPWRPYEQTERQKKTWELILEAIGNYVGGG